MRTIFALLLLGVVIAQAADYNFAILDDERITIYNTASTTAIRATRSITGLSAGDELEGIAFRPANNQIYAISERGYLYTIDPSSLAVTEVGRTNCSIETTDIDYFLSFNPVGDALRILGADGSNRRVNPANAACFVDSPIAYFEGNPANVVQPAGVAYSNQVASAPSTQEYFLDENNNGIASIFPFNGGNASLITITNPVIDFSDKSPMAFVTDTAADGTVTNTLFANINGFMYRIDLPAGTFTQLNRYANDDVDGMIVFPASFTIPAETTTTNGAQVSTTGTSGAASLTAVAALTLTAVAAALF